MKKGIWIAALLGIASLAIADPLVISTFDDDDEGWAGLTSFGPSGWSENFTGSVTYSSTDGNPVGSIRFADPDDQYTFFRAPGKFLGSQLAAYGGSLSYDQRTVTAAGPFDSEDVILKGAGLILVADLTGTPPPTDWTNYSVSLIETSWRIGSSSGLVPTRAQFESVLGSLDQLWINAEYYSPVEETIALDNVVLSSPVPEPATLAALAVGLVTLRRRKRL